MPRPVRLYTDENIDARLAPALVERGYDAISCLAAGNANAGLSDEWQLEWAVTHGRAILTIDVPDFTQLATLWSIQQRHHCGILFVRWMDLRSLLRLLTGFMDRNSADDIENIAMWVS